MKRGKSFKDVVPAPSGKGQVTIKQDKISDVDKLLIKHFGNEWRLRNELEYYKCVCDGTETNQEEEVCEPCLPEEGLMI